MEGWRGGKEVAGGKGVVLSGAGRVLTREPGHLSGKKRRRGEEGEERKRAAEIRNRTGEGCDSQCER